MLSGAEIGIILLVVALLVILPRIRRGAVALVDEQALGSKELAAIQQTHRVRPCESALVEQVLADFRTRLRLRVPALRAMVVERAGLNAAALADGTVVLWAGLVEEVDGGQIPLDELAGLLAHEIAHIELGHGRQRAVQELLAGPLTGKLALLVGGPLGRTVVGKGVDLLRKGASRDIELEADRVAAGLLQRAGFDPGGLERFLGRLADRAPTQPEWAAWLSTHPHMAQRRAQLRDRAGRPGRGMG